MRVSDEIMSNYQHVISELILRPGPSGVFDVHVRADDPGAGAGAGDPGAGPGGETGDAAVQRIFSKKRVGRQAEPGEVLAALEPLLPPNTRRYGT